MAELKFELDPVSFVELAGPTERIRKETYFAPIHCSITSTSHLQLILDVKRRRVDRVTYSTWSLHVEFPTGDIPTEDDIKVPVLSRERSSKIYANIRFETRFLRVAR